MAGKGARSRSKAKRKREKDARKAAKKALYESYKNAGRNSKSKRYRQNVKMHAGPKPRNHSEGPCGNHACQECFPSSFPQYRRKDGSVMPGTPHWVFLRMVA